MKFVTPLVAGLLIRRHSRFLADVELDCGQKITAHTSNTGSMMGCQEPGSRVWLSVSNNPDRKYAHTWEIIEVSSEGNPVLVGINTQLSNKLVAEGIGSNVIVDLQGYDAIRTEVKYGEENSRIDLLLTSSVKTGAEGKGGVPCYVEVKNVTLAESGVASFPDAISKRGAKHLRELISVARAGGRAVIFFCVQRGDVDRVRPADHIDKAYGEWLRRAVESGVEAIAYRAVVTPEEIVLHTKLPVVVD